MFTEVLLGVVLVFILYLLNKKPANLPPGLWGLPLFGSLPRKDLHMIDQAREHSKKFGEIFSWRIGSRIYIFLCNYNTIKAALKKPEVSGRAKLYSNSMVTNFVNAGVFQSNGLLWQNNRRFGLFHLKNLGLGKSSYEAVIQDEVMCLLKNFESSADKGPSPITWSLNVSVLNVFWRLCADRRYDVNDAELHYFHNLIEELLTDIPIALTFYDNFPSLYKIIPNFMNEWFGINEFLARLTELKEFILRIIDDHKKTYDQENPRDLIDHYLIEMNKQEKNSDSTMSDIDLMKFVLDLFVAGSETTSSTIRWAIFYLAKHPEIQKKMQQQLDSVVDRNTLPSLTDRDRLPYLEAVIHEVQRTISLLPMAVPHRATENTTLNGYSIPKDAIIMPCLNQCHIDPAYWKKPYEFYPENFLDDEGKLIKGKEGYVPFSIGKRVCLGESLAVMELFLFVSAIFQKFTFVLPQGEDFDRKRNPKDRIINTCKPYKVLIKERC